MAGFLKTFRLFNNCTNSTIPKMGIGLLNMQPPIRTIKADTREMLKQLNIPEKPKKPMTPYIQFVTEKQSIIAKENPKLKQSDIFKKCAEDWKTTSETAKEKYIQKYKVESEIYHDEILRYNAKLTKEQVAALKTVEEEKKKAKAKRKINKLNKENSKPKRPLGPYLLFLKEQSQSRNISPKDLMKSLKGEWDNLADGEKQRYRDQFSKEKEKYDLALMKWEEKMIADGHKELVRVKSLPEERPSRIRTLKAEKKITEKTIQKDKNPQ